MNVTKLLDLWSSEYGKLNCKLLRDVILKGYVLLIIQIR